VVILIKLNKKGFFLIETIAIISVVAIVLVSLYSQISILYNNYIRNANYNTVESIHAVRNVKTYIEQHYTPSLISDLGSSTSPLLDIKNYGFDTTGYYNALITDLNIKNIYFSSYNINSLLTDYASYNIDASFLDYLKTLKVSDAKPDTYRIIIILNNGNYSNIYFSTAGLS
jgi:Tfp pilus assembly protein PilE